MRITKRFFPLCGRKGRTSKPNIRKPHDVFYRFRFPYGPQPGSPHAPGGSHLIGRGCRLPGTVRACKPRSASGAAVRVFPKRLLQRTVFQMRRSDKSDGPGSIPQKTFSATGSENRPAPTGAIAAARFPQRGKPVCVREKPDRSQPRTGTALHSTEDDPTAADLRLRGKNGIFAKPASRHSGPRVRTLSRTHSKTDLKSTEE